MRKWGGMYQKGRSLPAAMWLLLLLLIIVIVVAVKSCVPHEQNDLTTRAQAALNDAGLSDVAVEFQGRDALLSGYVPAIEDIDRASETVFDVRGVRRVDNDALSVSDSVPLEPANFSARASDTQVILNGVMPTQQNINAIAEAASVRYATVNNQMTAGKVATAAWIERLPELFTQVDAWDSWNLDINADGTWFDGLARNTEAVAALRDGYFAGVSGLRFDGRVDSAAVATALTELLAGIASFETASAILSTSAETLLDRAIKILKANPDTVVSVEGHTDSQGKGANNMKLSQARAQAVVDYLISGGVDASRLKAIGYGETRPIADNTTAKGRAQNRRIEFVVKTRGLS